MRNTRSKILISLGMVDWGPGAGFLTVQISVIRMCSKEIMWVIILMQLVCLGLVVQASHSIPNCLSTQENLTLLWHTVLKQLSRTNLTIFHYVIDVIMLFIFMR